MDNAEIKAKKLELKKEIEQLSSKTTNPSSIRTKDGQPYVNSPELAVDKEKLNQKVAEFNSLVESFVVANLTMDKILTFSDGNHTIKYVPKKNRFDFYIGNEYQRGTVSFGEDGESATVTIPMTNSDTHGELVNYIYKVKIAKPIDPIVKQAKAERPCSKLAEGTATLNQDDAYWKSLGFVKDANTGTMRKMNPEEYDQTLKKQQKKAVPVKKNSKISFGRFLKK